MVDFNANCVAENIKEKKTKGEVRVTRLSIVSSSNGLGRNN